MEQPRTAAGAEMIRLCIVDDMPSVRQGLHMRLAAESDIAVVGEASDGEAGILLAVALCPDVLVMDVELPRQDGIAATRALRAVCPHTAVIMLSVHDDARTRARAEDAGAAAFVSKSLPPDDLVTVIRHIARPQGCAPIAPGPHP